MTEDEAMRIFNPPEFEHSVGSITPADIQRETIADPRLATKIEAILIVSRHDRDRDGLLTGNYRMSPSMALAIIRVVEAKEVSPIQIAEDIINGRSNP